MKGYAALTSVLMIGAVAMIISTTVIYNSIAEGQTSLGGFQKEKLLNLTESCGERALLMLNESNSLPSQISLNEGVCNVTVNSNVGGSWDFSVRSNLNGDYEKTIRIECTRGNVIKINKWVEL